MWRLLFLAIFLTSLPTALRAQESWQACHAAPGAAAPVLSDCRPVEGVIDPQGRELWLRSAVRRPAGDDPAALYIVGVASSEVWFNGEPLGANGRPGSSARAETPGRYQIAMPIPERLWRDGDNSVVVHMSSFHGAVRLDQPIAGLMVAPWPWPSPTAMLAVAFIAAGALFAAAFGFGVIHGLRRTGSSLSLAVLAAVAGLQAVLESLRHLIPYAYPFHAPRLVGIWILSAAFAILLVHYVSTRFQPGARRLLLGLTAAAVVAAWFAPGFDLKTWLALMAGVAVAGVAAAVGARRRLPGARPTLAWLAAFLAVGGLFPDWLVDLSYFLFAACLVLPLLMVEVVRLGRDDQAREAALARAAATPDCLTVVAAKRVERVPLSDIVAVVGADDYVELRLADGRRLLHAARLDKLEAELPPAFLRIHRSVIVHLLHARALERDDGRARLLMRNGDPLPISRNRLAAVREALDDQSLG